MTVFLPFLAAILFPALFLLQVRADFNSDWNNHQWMINYFGEYFRNHTCFPIFVNTQEVVGMPNTLFYGYFFYPLFGFFSSFLHAGFVIRLFVFFAFGLQFYYVRRVLTVDILPRFFSFVIACMTIWTTYSLTNLYNRSALTEFFAVSMLTCSFLCWVCFMREKEPARKKLELWTFFLFFILALGFHPITALCSSLFYAFLWIQSRKEIPYKKIAYYALFFIFCSLFILLPWCYLSFYYSFETRISNAYYGNPPWSAPESIDAWFTRFFPIPFDIRLLRANLWSISTPYLDAQINLPLLIMVCLTAFWVFLFTSQKKEFFKTLSIPLFSFFFFTGLSLSPSMNEHMPRLYRMVQMIYRWISYQNLSLLWIAICLFRSQSFQELKEVLYQKLKTLCTVCITYACVSVIIKTTHVLPYYHLRHQPIATFWNRDFIAKEAIHLPSTYYGTFDYSISSPYAFFNYKNFIEKKFSVSEKNGSFGEIQPLLIKGSRKTIPFKTNIQTFPWGQFYLNGKLLPKNLIQVDGSGYYFLKIEPTAGLDSYTPEENHELTYKAHPDPIWITLRQISFVAWLFFIGTGCFLFLSRKLKQ